jgi:hypothetical protein
MPRYGILINNPGNDRIRKTFERVKRPIFAADDVEM